MLETKDILGKDDTIEVRVTEIKRMFDGYFDIGREIIHRKSCLMITELGKFRSIDLFHVGDIDSVRVLDVHQGPDK